VWRAPQFFGPRQLERGERGSAMKLQRSFGAGLTVRESGELVAVAKEKLHLAARPVELPYLAAIQGQIGRGQDHEARLVRVFPTHQDHHAQLVLEGDMPDQGRVERDLGPLRQRAQGLKAVQVVKVALAVRRALGPAALGVGPGLEEAAVGVVAQLGERGELEGHDLSKVVLFCKIAVHALRGDRGRHSVAGIVQVRLVELNARPVLCGVPGGLFLARGGLGSGEGEGTAASDLHHRDRRHLQPAFGPTGAAIEEGS
jgi:hypothetical protein